MVEETGEPGENHWPAASHWQTLSHNVASSTPYLSRIQTHNVSTLVMIDTDFIGSYKSNYHMMTTITAPPNHLKVWVTTWDIENRTNRTTWQSQRGLFSPPPHWRSESVSDCRLTPNERQLFNYIMSRISYIWWWLLCTRPTLLIGFL
jgi:hypothetical protein